MTTKPPVHPIPEYVLQLLGPPPILASEDAKLYYTMLVVFAQSIRPDDLITWMLIKDLVDCRVEIARYRRIKIGLIAAPHWKSVTRRDDHMRALKEMIREDYRRQNLTPEQIEQKERESAEKLKSDERFTKLLASLAKSKDEASPETPYIDGFAGWIGNVERLDALLVAAEERFTATLEEIDRHLRGLGRLLREELDKIIEGELVETEAADAEPPKRPRTRRGVSREALANAVSPISPTARARRSGDGASSARSRRLARGSG
jgi:hypothetical protein